MSNYLKNHTQSKDVETNLLKSMDEVRKNEEKLQRIFECVADGVVVTDLHGTVTELNEQIVQIHGAGPKENLLGKNVLEFIALRDQKEAVKRMQKLSQQGGSETGEFSLLRADGSEFSAEIRQGY